MSTNQQAGKTWIPCARALALLLTMGLFLACSAAAPTPTPTPTLATELVFYDWADDMPQSVLDAFTQEYGVKIVYKIYESEDEPIKNMRTGERYDVVVVANRFIPLLTEAGLLAEIHHHNVPNLKNISANFRDLVYDPGERHSVPFNWGTTGLVVRTDLAQEPITRWADLWDPRYAGRTGIWSGQPREVLGLTLKALGYSANSENPQALEAALQHLLELKPHLLFMEDYELESSANVMNSDKVVVTMGYASDVLQGQEENKAITYVLPKEGALMWGDAFVIPANSAHKYSAELFLNFLMRPEINAQIANLNLYATPNEAALPFIKPEILNNPVIFPPQADMKNAEIILPLSTRGEKLYDATWARFLATGPHAKPSLELQSNSQPAKVQVDTPQPIGIRYAP